MAISPILPVYNRSKLSFEYGQGAYLFSIDGKRFLDFASGIAVNALGHSHPAVINALKKQADKIWHVSNLYEIPGAKKLAEQLTNTTFADTVFFCNSGAEAVECGIKMIRKYHDETGNPDKYRIITFSGAFHGRTIATISASAKESCLHGFEPALDGFDKVEFDDIKAVERAITSKTAGVLIEPIQGDGGIRVPKKEFLQQLRKLCDEKGLLLFFDEVQTGVGRTGKLYAYEHFGVKPDIMSTAKALANGFPIGACLATEKVGQVMTIGSHGSTFGSNPLAMAVASAVLNIIDNSQFLERVTKLGDDIKEKLIDLKEKHPNTIEEVRGIGMMLGIKVKVPNRIMVDKFREVGLLTAPASDNVIRIFPPLIVNENHISEAIDKMKVILKVSP